MRFMVDDVDTGAVTVEEDNPNDVSVRIDEVVVGYFSGADNTFTVYKSVLVENFGVNTIIDGE